MNSLLTKILALRAKFPNYPVVIYPTTNSKTQFVEVKDGYMKYIGHNWTVYHFPVEESSFYLLTSFDTKLVLRDKYFKPYNYWGSELCKLRFELQQYMSKEDSLSRNLIFDYKDNTLYQIEKFWLVNKTLLTAANYSVYGPCILVPKTQH